MKKLIPFFICCIIGFSAFSQTNKEEKIVFRKLNYNYFSEMSVDDTSLAVVDLFFRKKDVAKNGQMSFIPISAVLFAIPPSRLIGAGTAVATVPLFLNGSIMLIKYRNKKLYAVLEEYKKTKTLPAWIRKRANKVLDYYKEAKLEY